MMRRSLAFVITAVSLQLEASAFLPSRRPMGFISGSEVRNHQATQVAPHGNQPPSLAASNDDLSDLRRTVAEQDADWYRLFVADVLGEDERDGVGGTTANDTSLKTSVAATSDDSDPMPSINNQNQQNATSVKECRGDGTTTRRQAEAQTKEEAPSGEISDAPGPPQVAIHTVVELRNSSRVIPETSFAYKENEEEEAEAEAEADAVETVSPVNVTAQGETDSWQLPVAYSQNDNATTTLARTNISETLATPKSDGDEAGSVNLTVLYRDLYSGSLKSIPLSVLATLGYSTHEIPYLQPDALALIVSDEIRKPSRGIPQQWKISESQYEVLSDDVRIVSTQEASDILVTARDRRKKESSVRESTPAGKEDHRDEAVVGYRNRKKAIRDRKDNRPMSERTPASMQSQDGTRSGEIPVVRREERGSLPSRPASSTRRRTGRNSSKRIYSVRESSDNRSPHEIDDPPPPKGPLWVDIDTFRDLLRREAGVRVRILGEDWADVVREESNWRLRLYKEWLWTLDRGWGSPLIPSRSERAQTMSRRAGPMRSRQAPTRRGPPTTGMGDAARQPIVSRQGRTSYKRRDEASMGKPNYSSEAERRSGQEAKRQQTAPDRTPGIADRTASRVPRREDEIGPT